MIISKKNIYSYRPSRMYNLSRLNILTEKRFGHSIFKRLGGEKRTGNDDLGGLRKRLCGEKMYYTL